MGLKVYLTFSILQLHVYGCVFIFHFSSIQEKAENEFSSLHESIIRKQTTKIAGSNAANIGESNDIDYRSHLKPKMSMFCGLSQNYQNSFDKY